MGLAKDETTEENMNQASLQSLKMAALFCSVVILGFAAGQTVENTLTETPDEIGNAQQAEVYQSLTEQFSALQSTRTSLELNGGDTSKLDDDTRQVLTNLYTQGSTEQGAAISESQFETLLEYVNNPVNRIASYKYDYQPSVDAGMLDECIAATYSSDKSQASLDINACMHETHLKNDDAALKTALSILALGFLGVSAVNRDEKKRPKKPNMPNL